MMSQAHVQVPSGTKHFGPLPVSAPMATSHASGYNTSIGKRIFLTAGLVVAAGTANPDHLILSSGMPQKNRNASAVAEQTARNGYYEFVTTVSTAADPVISEVQAYLDLQAGWDGENAAAPNASSVKDACDFARRLGMSADLVSASLDTDGSVVFEIDDDGGLIMFRGNRKIVYALKNGNRGQTDFDGFAIPAEIMTAISA